MGEQRDIFQELNVEVNVPAGAVDGQPAPAPEKSKRGRKAGGKNKPKEPAQASEKKETSESDFFEQAIKTAAENKKEEPAISAPAGEALTEEKEQLLTGYMMLVVMDAFIPKLVGKFLLKKTQGIKKLSKEQKKELEPIANAAAKKLFSEIDPVKGFLVVYVALTVANNSDIDE